MLLAQPTLSDLLPSYGSNRLLNSRTVQAQGLSLDNAFRKAGRMQNFLCFQRMLVLTRRKKKSVTVFCSYSCRGDIFRDAIPLLKTMGQRSGGKLWYLYNHSLCTFPWGSRVPAVGCAYIFKFCVSGFFLFLVSVRYMVHVTSQLISMTAPACPSVYDTAVLIHGWQ